jgi:uncharacterized membrane-anchored protein
MTPAAPATITTTAEARADPVAILGLPEHPDRGAAIAEAHARPSLPIDVPATIHHLAISTPDPEADAVIYRSLFDDDVAAAPRHRILRRGALTVKWEKHTEFVSITLMSHGDSRVGDELIARVRSVFPAGASLLVALRVRVVRERTAPVIEDAIGGVLRGGIEVTSTFHVGPAGFIDFEAVAPDVGREQLGRRLQRVLDAETYRTMALVGLPLARRIGPELTALEAGLSEVTEMLSRGEGSDDEILERLRSLSARTEAMRARTRYRFAASRAYATLVDERLASLAEEKVGERPTLTGFTRTRLGPAIRTILSAEARQAELSTALGRALSLLRARVDVAMNAANQEILSTMNERQHRQLVISEAVESLSVIAISYYLLGILSYPVKALRDAGILPVSEVAALGILAPAVALLVYGGLRAIRRRWLDKDG